MPSMAAAPTGANGLHVTSMIVRGSLSAGDGMADLSLFIRFSVWPPPPFLRVPPAVSKLYPRWDDFCALRAKVDPHGMFVNAYAQRLFRIDANGKPL